MIKKCHIKSRLDCAKTNLYHDNEFFKKTLWTDESKTDIFDNNDATHASRENGAANSHKNTIPTMKHVGGNIMVRFFVYSETEDLRNIDSTKKSVKYIRILDDYLQSSVQKLQIGPN